MDLSFINDYVDLRQRAVKISEIIKRCEDIQREDVSDYHKDRAKVLAYYEIVKIWKGRY